MKLDKSIFANEKIEVKINHQGGEIVLYANQLGYAQISKLAENYKNSGDLAQFIVHCVTDKEGNRFTAEEASRLKKEIAEPLFEAILSVNGLGEKEKN